MNWAFIVLFVSANSLSVPNRNQRFQRQNNDDGLNQFQTPLDDGIDFNPGGQKVPDEVEKEVLPGGNKPKPGPKEEDSWENAKPFAYNYNVDDEKGSKYSHKAESDPEGLIQGEYRVLLPDGRVQIVEYTADWKNGYRAKVRYEGATPSLQPQQQQLAQASQIFPRFTKVNEKKTAKRQQQRAAASEISPSFIKGIEKQTHSKVQTSFKNFKVTPTVTTTTLRITKTPNGKFSSKFQAPSWTRTYPTVQRSEPQCPFGNCDIDLVVGESTNIVKEIRIPRTRFGRQDQEQLPADPPPPAEQEEINLPGSTDQDPEHHNAPYGFQYNVNDEKGNSFSQKAEADSDGVVKGEYRVLLPDGRTQIVTYIADWKNGYQPTIRYEGTPRPWVPPPKPIVDESETDIQPGGFTPAPNCYKGSRDPKCNKPIDETETDIQPGGFTPAPSCYKGSKDPKCNKPIDETETDIQPGGFTPAPSCYKGSRDPKCNKPIDETETDIQPGGFTPAPSCYKGSRDPKCNKPIDETETDIQPGGFTPAPSCYKGSRDPKCNKPIDETETDIQPGGFTPAPSCYKGSKDPKCNKPIDETETDIQPGGFTPPPSCYPGSKNPNCKKPLTPQQKCLKENPKNPAMCFPELCYAGSKHPRCKKPAENLHETEDEIQPAGQGCVKGSKDPQCNKPIDETETDIQPGGFTPPPSCHPGSKNPNCKKPLTPQQKCLKENPKNPAICFPELCYAGSKHPRCKKPAENLPDETEDEVQPGGHGCVKGTKGPNCPEEHETNIEPPARKPCYPPSGGPECLQPGPTQPPWVPCLPGFKGPNCMPDEDETDIQPGGQTSRNPRTSTTSTTTLKPISTLYGTPEQPFEVRLNRKFGY